MQTLLILSILSLIISISLLGYTIFKNIKEIKEYEKNIHISEEYIKILAYHYNNLFKIEQENIDLINKIEEQH